MRKREPKNRRDPEAIYKKKVDGRNKPTKNQFWCPYSNRPKMKFDTKEEAIRFIRYNKSDVGTYLRAYYCPACACWHLTKQTLEEHISRLDELHERRSNVREYTSRS